MNTLKRKRKKIGLPPTIVVFFRRAPDSVSGELLWGSSKLSLSPLDGVGIPNVWVSLGTPKRFIYSLIAINEKNHNPTIVGNYLILGHLFELEFSN